MSRTKPAPTEAPDAAFAANPSPDNAADTPITLEGRLCSDPVLRHTASGIPVTNLRIAVNRPDGEATFHTVVAWKRTAEVVVQYLKKGRLVQVSGFPRERTWTDSDQNERTSTEINAFRVEFVSRQRTAQPAAAAVA
jgi:single-strand DNA-binding protein